MFNSAVTTTGFTVKNEHFIKSLRVKRVKLKTTIRQNDSSCSVDTHRIVVGHTIPTQLQILTMLKILH